MIAGHNSKCKFNPGEEVDENGKFRTNGSGQHGQRQRHEQQEQRWPPPAEAGAKAPWRSS